jgi:hypothetical protein
MHDAQADTSIPHAMTRIFLAWIGLLFGAVENITLAQVALTATTLFTLLQTYFLVRDRWWRDKYGK